MSEKILKVGTVVTCQFGNDFDTHGYEKSVNVTVLGYKILAHMADEPIYLVKRHGSNKIGRATLPFREREADDDIIADLYCTACITYGNEGDRVDTLEAAVAAIF